MMTKAEQVLINGLKAGYAGSDTPHTITRGSFVGKESLISFPDSHAEYNDQWFFKRTGGGQDMARFGDELVTRVFAGGVVKPEKLQKLGITEQQVLTYHKRKLSELVDRTRLHESVTPEKDGDWQYRYEVVNDYPDVPLTVGVETITYKDAKVFIHIFLNSQIQ